MVSLCGVAPASGLSTLPFLQAVNPKTSNVIIIVIRLFLIITVTVLWPQK